MNKYGEAIEIVKNKIPIGINNPEVSDMMLEFQRYFNYMSPDFKSINNIVVSNKDLFKEVSQQLLTQYNLNNQITVCQMMRCISTNLHLFAFTVLYMANSQYSEYMDSIKTDFIQSKIDNQ